tara:strand:+ start:178 stop:990 length:813 start_codon:yes stop_codon:yes gene_type:complete
MLGLGNSVTSAYVQQDAYVDPSSLGTLALWLKFNTDIFADEPDAGNSNDDTLSHNDRINEWRDQSGNNNHAVQTTTTFKPRVDINNNSGAEKGSVNFINNVKYMDLTSSISLTGDFTIMIRFTLDNANNPRAFLGNSSDDLLRLQDASDFRTALGGSDTSAFKESSLVITSSNHTVKSIVTFTRSSGALSIHVNAGVSGSGFNNVHDDVDWDAAENHTDSDAFTITNIGSQADDTEEFRGHFYDVLIYDGVALTESQRKLNYDYLNGQTL